MVLLLRNGRREDRRKYDAGKGVSHVLRLLDPLHIFARRPLEGI
jgi:hypothetical protein